MVQLQRFQGLPPVRQIRCIRQYSRELDQVFGKTTNQ